VATIQNIATSWKLGIAKVVAKNNGVWDTNLVAPNTLLGMCVLEVELDNLVVVIDPLVIDAKIFKEFHGNVKSGKNLYIRV
jgi:hypothetical protein